MDADTLAKRYADARDALLIEFGTQWTIRKPGLMLWHRAFTLVLFWSAGYRGPRFIGVLALYGFLFAMEIHDALRVRRLQLCREVPCTEGQIAWNTAFGLLMLGVGCAFTGGYGSPLIPLLLAPVVIPAAAFGRRPTTYWLLAELVLILVILLVLPESILGPLLPSPAIAIGIGGSIAYAVWLSVTNIVTLTEVYERAAVMAARMREEVLEEHDARARNLETLSAKVAHELKNPLAAIAGLVQLLQEGAHDSKTQERLAVVASEVGRVERVMRDYLAFSKPLDVVLAACNLDEVVDDVLLLLEARARMRGVTLTRSGPRVATQADARRLKEALLNLVDNAIEASPQHSSVEIEIVCEPAQLQVRVRDQGEGISAENLVRLGTPYFTTRPQGTGLGVVMARSVVEAHGGTLRFESQPKVGTVAEISLPAHQPNDGVRAA